MCIPALLLMEIIKFSSPDGNTSPKIEREDCSSLSLVANSIELWMSVSGNQSARDRLHVSEMLDMSFAELQTIANFSSDDIMGLINRTLHGINRDPFNAQDPWVVCLQRHLNRSFFPVRGSYHQDNGIATISTMVENCCNELETQQRDRTESSFPMSAISDQMPKYTIPDALNVYKNRTWIVSLISFHQFRGELYNNQRRALLELLFLIRRYAPDRGIVEPVFVFNPRNSAIYEKLYVEAPEILMKLSPSNSSEEFVWNNSIIRTSFGIFASAAGTLLDMVTLSKGLKSEVLPYDDFRRFSDHTLDELLITDESLTGAQPELECSRFVLNVEAEFLGHRWNVSRFKCLRDACIEPSCAEALSESSSKNIGCAYSRTRLCGGGKKPVFQWSYASLEYLRTRAFLRFSGPVVAQALAFIQREFDGAPFLGVHWRRGDRLVFMSWGLSVDIETVVVRTWEECQAQDLAEVYLMTNCGLAEDLAAVVGGLASLGIRVRMAEAHRAWEEEDRRLALEMAIMSFAEHVVISSSAVSSSILEERVLLGHPLAAWSSLAPESGYARQYEDLMDCLQRELLEHPDLRRAVESQAGLPRRVLDCLHDAPPAAATPAACAALGINSSRFIASSLP